MDQNKAKNGIVGQNSLGKPLCAVMILCSCMVGMPISALAENEKAVSLYAVPQSTTQQITVKGNISDAAGEPIIGASIVQKGTTNGIVSDIDGNFSLTVPQGATLEIACLGYTTQEVVANSNVKVVLEEDTQTLEEVVAVGYGTMKKRDLTGAIVSIKSEDVVMNPGTNPMQSLQGKVAGLDIQKSSGQAGSGVTMQLRGTRSFSASGNPLFIIDGMAGDYSTLNPNDIESIEVLKDASSTAIYGSSGSNGVILITTKSGKEGKIAVNFNAFLGVNGWAKTPKMRSGESYIQTLRDASVGAGDGRWSSSADDENLFNTAAEWDAHKNGQYIDWVDALLETSVTQNYSLSLSGGTEKTKAYFSLNFSDEEGQFAQDSYKVYSSKIRVDHKVRNWLTAGVDAQMSYVHQNAADSDLQTLMVSNPLGSLYNEDGSINPQPCADPSSTTYNYLLNNSKDVYRNQNQNFKLYFNPYLELRPIKGLTFITRAGGALSYSRKNQFTGEGSVQWYKANQTEDGIKATITDSRSYNYKWENILTYNFKIADVHDITLTAVSTYNHNQSDKVVLYQKGVSDNKYLWHNILDGNSSTSGNSTYSMSKGMGYVGRINYSFMGKYLLSASVRHDGSSRLAEDNQWDTFPAFSLGWRISDEKFMDSFEWLNNLKLRVGYGVTGTAGIDPYSSAASLDAQKVNMALGGVLTSITAFSQNIPNYQLGWEKSHNTNVGIDAAFLNNKIDVTMEYYNTNTTDVIWKKSLPIVNGGYGVDGGTSSMYTTNVNMCETNNKGFELALNTRNISRKDFSWTTSLTFNYNKEKITKLAGGDSDFVSNGTTGYVLAMDEAVNSYYHYKLNGIWQLGEEDEAAVFGAEPGDIKVDVPNLVKVENGKYYRNDKDGNAETDDDGNIIYYSSEHKYVVSDKDYQVLGHNSPDWTLGFQNNFTYKNFDLSVFVYARYGQMFKYDMLTSYDPTGKNNFPEYFDYWTPTNASNDFPAANASKSLKDYTGYYALSYVDGSFMKIKNITLGYTLPKTVLKYAGIEKCRFYATITNPFVIAKSDLLKDYDPEMNGSLKYPLAKQFVCGVNVTF